jgi:hypothetical protein
MARIAAIAILSAVVMGWNTVALRGVKRWSSRDVGIEFSSVSPSSSILEEMLDESPIDIEGEDSLEDWARQFGVSKAALQYRIRSF